MVKMKHSRWQEIEMIKTNRFSKPVKGALDNREVHTYWIVEQLLEIVKEQENRIVELEKGSIDGMSESRI